MLAPLNSTMLAVALSPISEEFDISTGWTTWLIAAYLIVMAVGQPISGRMGDMYGRRRLFIWGLVYFAAASALAMVSWNFPSLVFFRVQQAIGAAMFMSNGIAALRSSLPQESRGRAFGLMGGIIAMSAGIGPPLGGILVDGIGWRALFAVNLPVVLLALALSLKYLPKDLPGRSRQPLDVLGAGALATGLLALMIAATSLGREGAGDPLFWSMTLVFCASAAFFLWWEGHYSSPLISLAMFRRRSYAAGASTIFLSNMAMYALFIMVPLFVQDLKGDSPTRSGLALISLALFAILLSPLSGYVADRVGRNLPAVVGAVLLHFHHRLGHQQRHAIHGVQPRPLRRRSGGDADPGTDRGHRVLPPGDGRGCLRNIRHRPLPWGHRGHRAGGSLPGWRRPDRNQHVPKPDHSPGRRRRPYHCQHHQHPPVDRGPRWGKERGQPAGELASFRPPTERPSDLLTGLYCS